MLTFPIRCCANHRLHSFFMRDQEILSGGQGINDPEELEARMRKKGVDPKSPGLKE